MESWNSSSNHFKSWLFLLSWGLYFNILNRIILVHSALYSAYLLRRPCVFKVISTYEVVNLLWLFESVKIKVSNHVAEMARRKRRTFLEASREPQRLSRGCHQTSESPICIWRPLRPLEASNKAPPFPPRHSRQMNWHFDFDTFKESIVDWLSPSGVASFQRTMRMSIYSYTFDFDTFKNDTFKSVIFRNSQKWLFGSFWHFWRKFWFWHFQEWHFWKCMSR